MENGKENLAYMNLIPPWLKSMNLFHFQQQSAFIKPNSPHLEARNSPSRSVKS